MELSRKKLFLAVALCLIIGTVNGYAISKIAFVSYYHPMTPTANVFVTVQTEMGTYDLMNHNVITNIGENQTGYRMGINGTHVQTRWISLGNATADAALTKLTTEATTLGADRHLGTYINYTSGGDFAFNVTNKFTFTGDISLGCAGLHWSDVDDSDNNMFACADFTQTAFANNWNLTITWSVVFNGND